jgi:site-specific DNA-methyltransferase (adenine-specific)
MKSYYEHAGITIFHADCLEVLPTLRDIDLLCTDPAYQIESGGNSSGRMMGGMFDPSIYNNNGNLFPTVPYAKWVPLAAAALAPNADVFIMANDKNLRDCLNAMNASGIDLHNIFVWSKANKTPNRWGMKSAEFIAYGWQGLARNLNDMGLSQVFHDHNPIGNKRHPTEKPVSLMRKLIENATDLGELVLDPFMGCGSTLVAAKLSGRRAVGIEISEQHCEKAASWIDSIQVLDKQQQEVMELV